VGTAGAGVAPIKRRRLEVNRAQELGAILRGAEDQRAQHTSDNAEQGCTGVLRGRCEAESNRIPKVTDKSNRTHLPLEVLQLVARSELPAL
jgi:hypothetical protein